MLKGPLHLKPQQAWCRVCKHPIRYDEPVFLEEHEDEPDGYIHAGCLTAYVKAEEDEHPNGRLTDEDEA